MKDVSLDASNNLVFTFETTSGETTTKVNIAKYIDTYTAGNGITVSNKVIAAKVKTGDAYLTVDANGIASKGIDSAISTAVSNASTAWNTKLNAAKMKLMLVLMLYKLKLLLQWSTKVIRQLSLKLLLVK